MGKLCFANWFKLTYISVEKVFVIKTNFLYKHGTKNKIATIKN